MFRSASHQVCYVGVTMFETCYAALRCHCFLEIMSLCSEHSVVGFQLRNVCAYFRADMPSVFLNIGPMVRSCEAIRSCRLSASERFALGHVITAFFGTSAREIQAKLVY